MAQLSPLEEKNNRLSPEELGLLAKELVAAPDPIEAERIKERLTRLLRHSRGPRCKVALRLCEH
jgi:hypothetical protein